MGEQPQKRRLQVHLSTAIVLMFVAGFIVWVNVRPETHIVDRRGIPCRWEGYLSTDVSYGFPISYRKFVTLVAANDDEAAHHFVDTDRRGIVIDAFVALATLVMVWFLCEHWIQWRAFRKIEQQSQKL
jgi:hypothetical protein